MTPIRTVSMTVEQYYDVLRSISARTCQDLAVQLVKLRDNVSQETFNAMLDLYASGDTVLHFEQAVLTQSEREHQRK